MSRTPRRPADELLPDGFCVELDPTVLRLDGGRFLVGGSPLTAMRLSSAARALFAGRRVVVSGTASAAVAERLLAANLARPVLGSADELEPSSVTVVVPVRDRAEQLDRCLAALAPLRVVVVDDASIEPDAVAAVARRHDAEVVHLSVNLGPGGARNEGLARVTTPVVAFVDSDVEAPAEALLRLTRHLADPRVALVGPRVHGHLRTDHPRWFERYDAAASSLDLGSRPAAAGRGASVGWLPGACLVGLTSSLGEGFDADLRVGEDVDLVWRLVDEGWRVRYDPTSTVRHDVRPSVRGWLGRKFVYGSGSSLLAERHGRHVAPAVLSPTMAVAGAAVLVRRRGSAPVVFAALAHAAVTIHRALPADVPAGARRRVATALAARGTWWAVRQESSLLVRHWWPVAALALGSRTARRAVLAAVVVDGVVATLDHRDDRLDQPTLQLGRRLDDLAYGAGLWWGAVRSRSVRALLPRRPMSSRGA